MTLKEMATEYQHSAALCRKRITVIRRELRQSGLSRMERLRLRRRICVLESMARQTAATGRYLENYYREDDEYAGKCQQEGIIPFPSDGVSGAQAVYKAV